MMVERIEGRTRRTEFDSLAAFYKYAIFSPMPDDYDKDSLKKLASRKTRNDDWNGTDNWDGAVKLAMQGWTEGLDQLHYKLDKNNEFIKGVANKFNVRNDVAGAYVDVPRYLEGQPECMVEFENQIVNKFATVYVSLSCSGSVSGKRLMARGRKILSAIDMLESAGIRTKVVAIEHVEGWSCDGPNYHDSIHIVVKEFRDRLDIESMNFVLCCPAFLRRMIFSCDEHSTKEWREAMGYKTDGGYGTPCGIASLIQDSDPHIIFDTKAGWDDGWTDVDQKVKQIINQKGDIR